MKTAKLALALALTSGTLGGSFPGICPSIARAADRIPVKTADQLPRRTYKIPTPVADFIKDDAAINKLLDQLVADAQADLVAYDIQDKKTLSGFYEFLRVAAAFKGDYDKAMSYTPKIGELTDKESEKLMNGISLQAWAAAAKAGAVGSEAFSAVYKTELRARVSKLPLEPIRDKLISIRNSARMTSREMIEAGYPQADEILAGMHGDVPAGTATSIFMTRYSLDIGLKIMPLMGEVYGELLEGKMVLKKDLWTPRLVELATSEKASPVVIAIWDSGVDTALFPSQLWTNPKEIADGKDNDDNGFVDDLHGISFDVQHKPATGDVMPLDGLKGNHEELIAMIPASGDANEGLETPAVLKMRDFVKALRGQQVVDFQENMELLTHWCHGTHVAGIAASGNPFARLLYLRETFEHKSIPETAPTIEEYAQWGAAAKQAVDYFKAANVRVVNMSWRIPRAAVEAELAIKGVGKTPEERAEMSRKIFNAFREGLEEAIKRAPDILFVAGSGNEDNDVDFSEYIPAGLRLPNLVTVGAVDSAGRLASFTSMGKGVKFYANGFQVVSYIPGGQRVPISGASMASPQVANLAGKLIALKPTLKPTEVIDLITRGADAIEGQPGKTLINPKKSISLLQG